MLTGKILNNSHNSAPFDTLQIQKHICLTVTYSSLFFLHLRMGNNYFVLILVPLGIICFISLLFSHMDNIKGFIIDDIEDPLPKGNFFSFHFQP